MSRLRGGALIALGALTIACFVVPGAVTAGAVPETGRVLLGSVRAVTEGGVNVGSNELVVEHVSP